MRKGTPIYSVQATCTHATAGALRIDIGDGRPQWIPRALVAPESHVSGLGDSGRFVCTRDIAHQKGWC